MLGPTGQTPSHAMPRNTILENARAGYLAGALLFACAVQAADSPTTVAGAPVEADCVLENFKFSAGETLPRLRIHYRTVGQLRKTARGTNAVLIGHGTGGSGGQFIRPEFSGELFGAGQ